MNRKQLATHGIKKKNIIQRMFCKHEEHKQVQMTTFDENGHAVNAYRFYCKDCGQRV